MYRVDPINVPNNNFADLFVTPQMYRIEIIDSFISFKNKKKDSNYQEKEKNGIQIA
jgi:hypothetical protein